MSDKLEILKAQAKVYEDMYAKLLESEEGLYKIFDKWKGKKINKRLINEIKDYMKDDKLHIVTRYDNHWIELHLIDGYNNELRVYHPTYMRSLFRCGETNTEFDPEQAKVSLTQARDWLFGEFKRVTKFVSNYQEIFRQFYNIKAELELLNKEIPADAADLFKYDFKL